MPPSEDSGDTTKCDSSKTVTPADKTKMRLFSYHDINLIAVLRGLNASFDKFPPYSSAVFFDLTDMGEQNLAVRISYREGTKPPILVGIDSCTNPCPLGDFVALVDTRFPKRFTAWGCGYPRNHPFL